MKYSVLLLTVVTSTLLAQEGGPDIARYLAMISEGRKEEVRADLPSLLTRHPNNPGVLYVQGSVADDGAEAVRIFQSIVDNFPRSEWADDALYKVYQFYYALGLYRTADLKMEQLKKDYPTSPFVSGTKDVAVADLPEEPERPLSEEQPLSEAPQGQFALQVGAYSTQVNAEKQKLFFEDLGYQVDVLNKVRDGRSLYLVHIGSYATYEDAKARAAHIKATYNIESMVVTR